MRIHYWLVSCLALTALSCAGQEQDQNSVWKKAGADDGLRQAFERVVYRLEDAGPSAYLAVNPAQQLALEFQADETRLKHPRGEVDLRLIGYGYGARLRTPRKAVPVASENRVEYRRGDLREWYVNDSRGLEQGFTLARRPGAPQPGEPLVIALAVAGALRPELAAEGDAILFRSGDKAVLRYEGLRAWDARGRQLVSRLEAGERQVRLVVDDRDAVYPLVVDPVWNQQAELTAPDGSAGDEFGFSVAVSGNTAVVGAPQKTVGSNSDQGAAYVFARNGESWSLQQELTASDGAAGDEFGYSVSVDGSTAVVGSPFRTVGTNALQGAAYVFVSSGATWSQQQELTASSDGAADDEFGYSVSIGGNTAVTGAPGKNGFQGAAYVFVRGGAAWSQQQELTASDGSAGDAFGNSVSVSEDTAVAGAPDKTVGSNPEQGAAYVFVRSAAAWTQQSELTASDGAAADVFGFSVAVSGNTVVAGAPQKTINSNFGQGSAYMFVRSGAAWSQQQELLASNGAAIDFFGVAVAASGDTALIGAALKTIGSNAAQGAAYVFARSGVHWIQQQELTASDAALGDEFGNFVAVNWDTALIGAFNKTVGSNPAQGSAYVFVLAPDIYQIGYAANLSAGDSVVDLTNAGIRGGSDPAGGICANVYAFAPDQQMVACCACYLSPNDLQSLSAKQDLVSNTLTPGVPTSVTIVLVASDPVNSTTCNPAAPNPATLEQGMRAWGTTIHQGPSNTYQVTERAFLNAPLSGSELLKLTTTCGFINANGSGAGICNSCRPGALGAAKQ